MTGFVPALAIVNADKDNSAPSTADESARNFIRNLHFKNPGLGPFASFAAFFVTITFMFLLRKDSKIACPACRQGNSRRRRTASRGNVGNQRGECRLQVCRIKYCISTANHGGPRQRELARDRVVLR